MKRAILRDLSILDFDADKKTALFRIVDEGDANGVFFPAEALREAVGLMEGVKAFIDHRDVGMEENLVNPTDRSIRSLAGVWVNPIFNSFAKSIDATFIFMPTEENAFVWQLILHQQKIAEERMIPAQLFGVSVVMGFQQGFEGDKRIVRKIRRFFSADFVSDPARGGEFIKLLSSAGVEIPAGAKDKGAEFFLSPGVAGDKEKILSNSNQEFSEMDKELKALLEEVALLKSEVKEKEKEILTLSSGATENAKEIETLKTDNGKKEKEIKSLSSKADTEKLLIAKLDKTPELLQVKVREQVSALSDSGVIVGEKEIDTILASEKKYFDAVSQKEEKGAPGEKVPGSETVEGFSLEEEVSTLTGKDYTEKKDGK